MSIGGAVRAGVGVVVVGACLTVSATGHAQLSPRPLPVERTDVSAYPTVTAIVTAPPKAATDAITLDSFRVAEGNVVRPVSVERLPSSELAVVLVIDTSASMRGEPMVAAQKAATSFVEAMPGAASVAVVGFGSAPTVHHGFTADRAATNAAIGSLRASGYTTLYDAVLRGAALHAERPQKVNARKIMVVLTDGTDTKSVASLGDVSAVLSTSGISVTAIGLDTREGDLAALSVLATSAGGKVVSAADPTGLSAVFLDIAESVLNQYRLTWTTTSRGATDVTIDLVVGDATYHATQSVAFPQAAAAPTAGESLAPDAPARPAVPTPRGDDRVWLMVGVGSGFAALLCASALLLWPRAPRRRLAAELGMAALPGPTKPSTGIVAATDRLLRGRDRHHRIQVLLDRAGMKTEPAKAVVFAGAAATGALVIGLAIGSVLLALLLALMTVAGLYLAIHARAERRSRSFQEQFESTLQIMSNSLKAGYGINQAIDTVARESEAPTSEEFRRVVRETQLGMDQIVALQACAHRIKCEDLMWVTEAIAVNRNVGGNLTELFAGVAETIRARTRLARQVAALSAEGRLSAKILIAMPFAVLAALSLINRSYLDELFRGSGPLLLAGGAVLMTVGYLWIRRVIRVDY